MGGVTTAAHEVSGACARQLHVRFAQPRGEDARDVDDDEGKAVSVLLAEGGEVLGAQVEELRIRLRAYRGRPVLLVDEAHLPEELGRVERGDDLGLAGAVAAEDLPLAGDDDEQAVPELAFLEDQLPRREA